MALEWRRLWWNWRHFWLPLWYIIYRLFPTSVVIWWSQISGLFFLRKNIICDNQSNNWLRLIFKCITVIHWNTLCRITVLSQHQKKHKKLFYGDEVTHYHFSICCLLDERELRILYVFIAWCYEPSCAICLALQKNE